MKPVALTFVIALLGTTSLAAGERPTDLISADLGIPENVFVTCFADVRPDPDHAPDGATQHANKAILLPCLQAANPSISNDLLDSVMDRYRPEGPMRN